MTEFRSVRRLVPFLLLAAWPPRLVGAAPLAASPGGHAWLAEPDAPRVAGSLEDRFAAPDGFRRVDVGASSFGAFLRRLPLAPGGTPVLAFDGREILPGDHPSLAGVVALDVGARDLQQCADSVIRLHAEWRHANGAEDVVYRASSGAPLSYAAYLRGDRAVLRGSTLAIERRAPAVSRSHAALRSFLDEVFVWANTASLARSTTAVSIRDVRPGDFFVMPRRPVGHAVLVLDVARDASGHVALLLGQGFMPAQSFHVLRPSPRDVWFSVDEASGRVATPFWEPFPFETLHRFGDAGD